MAIEFYKGIYIPDKLLTNYRMSNGMPLPYVAEFDAGEEKKVEFYEGIPWLMCQCTLGRGRAYPGAMCVMRNRRSHSQRLCGACGRRISVRSWLYYVGAAGAEFFDEPGVHRECLIFSLQACTGITRNAEKLEVFKARSYDVWWKRMPVKEHDAPQVRTRPGVLHVGKYGPAAVAMFSVKPQVVSASPVVGFLERNEK